MNDSNFGAYLPVLTQISEFEIKKIFTDFKTNEMS